MSEIQIFYESTPNPHSMKFNLTRPISEETVFFDDPQKTLRSPLAQKLFGFPWTASVYIGPDFVTVTKQDWVEWSVLADPLSDLILEHVTGDEAVLLAQTEVNENSAVADTSDDTPVVQKIKHIINTEIRPAVAMDGGDILFSRYENNKLYIHMQGACSGCPSSTMTLKEGIEVRLKEAIPELEEVIAE